MTAKLKNCSLRISKYFTTHLVHTCSNVQLINNRHNVGIMNMYEPCMSHAYCHPYHVHRHTETDNMAPSSLKVKALDYREHDLYIICM